MLSGCIPYVLPDVAVVGGPATAGQPPDCRAFRVDATIDRADLDESITDFSLEEVAPSGASRLLPHGRVTFDYGYYVFGVAVNFPVDRVHVTRLRLYRPGYELVELDSWQPVRDVRWSAAATPVAQEKAIDDLLRPLTLNGMAKWQVEGRHDPLGSLPPGSKSAAYRDVLLLAAAEYERVANLAGPLGSAGTALDKARTLRALAEK